MLLVRHVLSLFSLDVLKDTLHCDYPNCIFSSISMPTPLVANHTHSDVITVTSPKVCSCTQGACSNKTDDETVVECERSKEATLAVSEVTPVISVTNDNELSTYQR